MKVQADDLPKLQSQDVYGVFSPGRANDFLQVLLNLTGISPGTKGLSCQDTEMVTRWTGLLTDSVLDGLFAGAQDSNEASGDLLNPFWTVYDGGGFAGAGKSPVYPGEAEVIQAMTPEEAVRWLKEGLKMILPEVLLMPGAGYPENPVLVQKNSPVFSMVDQPARGGQIIIGIAGEQNIEYDYFSPEKKQVNMPQVIQKTLAAGDAGLYYRVQADDPAMTSVVQVEVPEANQKMSSWARGNSVYPDEPEELPGDEPALLVAGRQRQTMASAPDSNEPVKAHKSQDFVSSVKNTVNYPEIETVGKEITGKQASQGANPAGVESEAAKLARWYEGNAIQAARPIMVMHASELNAKNLSSILLPAAGGLDRQVAGRSAVVRIKLEPENLGEIEIRLTFGKGELTAHFYTSVSATRDALESSLPFLRENLAQNSIILGDAAAYLGGEGANQDRYGQPATQGEFVQTPGIDTGSASSEREKPVSIFCRSLGGVLDVMI